MNNPVDFRRNANLDALRAIAIFMVLGRHSNYPAQWARAWSKVGWAGVDLFFVLSGFLVSGLLFSAYQERKQLDLSRFYIRRGFKIWPAFYVLIATGLIWDFVSSGHISAQGLWPELLFMQSYFPGIWGITWSLSVEEHFYLTLPLLLLLMLRRKTDKPFSAMPAVFAGVAIFCLACRFAVGWGQNENANFLVYQYPTHLRIDGLMFGVLLSYYHRFHPPVFRRIAGWRGSWVVILAALTLLSTIRVENHHMHTWGLTVLYVAAGLLVAKAVAFEGPKPVRAVSGILAVMGVYSYSIYLWHIFYREHILPLFHVPPGLLWFLCYLGGSILFGILAAKIIEIPALRFRDRVFPKNSRAKNALADTLSPDPLPKAPAAVV